MYLHYCADGTVRDHNGIEVMIQAHTCVFNHQYYWAKVQRYSRKINGYTIPGDVTLITYDRKVCECGKYIDETCNSVDVDHIEFDKSLEEQQ